MAITKRRGQSKVLVGSAVVFVLGVALGLSSCTPARKAPAAASSTASTAAPVVADTYAGTESCKECHLRSFNSFSETKMGRIFIKNPRDEREGRGCENCHGPSKLHVTTAGKIVGGLIVFTKGTSNPVAQRNQVCLTCHTKGARVFWEGSSHEASDIACTNCHTVMKDISNRHQLTKASELDTCGTCHLRQRAEQMRNSHMPVREGKMTCTSCHNPHGTATPALLKENSINDTCYACHAEKRGPFLWEHPPVLESCTNCHSPHGSNHEKMLKLAKPRLCSQCHNEIRAHPANPYGQGGGSPLSASVKFVFGRSCMNCHLNIHGSNHPQGAGFVR